MSLREFNFILDTLSIRFSKEATREMFNYMDGDCDGKLTYADFVNLKQFSMIGGTDAASINSFSTNLSRRSDPFVLMANDVEQRKEFDLMEWNDDIQGSKQQKKFKLNHLSGGKFSPREYSGTQYFESKISFLN